MEDPLQEGLRRHYWVISKISLLTVNNPAELIEIAKRIDELISAVAVDLLEKSDTDEKRLSEIKKIRAAFETRWKVVLPDPLGSKAVDAQKPLG